MSRTDAIRRIIAEQNNRGGISIEQFIRVRARDNSEAEIRDSIDYCREIIDAVPVIMDQVRRTAEERGFSNWVEPLVAHAEDYFLESEDYLPEKQLGAFGLLDDAYVALKVLSFLHAGSDPILRVEVDGPLDFLRQVLGDEATAKLDSVAGQVSCSSCGGYGYHTQSYTRVDWEGNTEYVTDQVPCSCSGGYSTCSSCGGSGWTMN